MPKQIMRKILDFWTNSECGPVKQVQLIWRWLNKDIFISGRTVPIDLSNFHLIRTNNEIETSSHSLLLSFLLFPPLSTHPLAAPPPPQTPCSLCYRPWRGSTRRRSAAPWSGRGRCTNRSCSSSADDLLLRNPPTSWTRQACCPAQPLL